MSVKVSIIIPLFNKEAFILKTLKSVWLQSFKDWECIIVNDGSTDMSLELVDNFCKTFPGNWVILTTKNCGQVSARNTGIDNAKGKYLAFLDADDLWLKDKLYDQFRYLELHPNVIGVLSSYAIFSETSSLFRIVSIKPFNRLLEGWASLRGFGGGLESVGMFRYSGQASDYYFDPSFSTSAGLDFAIRFGQKGQIDILESIGMLYRLSHGQWHTDVSELQRNMTLIAKKYNSLFKVDLNMSHISYFYWAAKKSQGLAVFGKFLFSNLFRSQSDRTKMLWSLFKRNLKAAALGRIRRRYICRQIQELAL